MDLTVPGFRGLWGCFSSLCNPVSKITLSRVKLSSIRRLVLQADCLPTRQSIAGSIHDGCGVAISCLEQLASVQSAGAPRAD